MFEEESRIAFEMCAGVTNSRVLNLCSADEAYYKKHQPHIWYNLMRPLTDNGNSLINLDLKRSRGVDIVADCCHMPIVADRSYDVVLFCSGLEHVAAPQGALAEIARVLKPGGFAVLSAPGVYPRHDDPIDTLLRFPHRDSWVDFLPSWTILDYRATTPRKTTRTGYAFAELVYATIVKTALP